MKILMLDVDGVLNSAEYMRERRHLPRPTPHAIDATTVPRLNAIIERTGAKIVISSTWRLHGRNADPPVDAVGRMASILAAHGVVGEVIGCTPQLLADVKDREGSQLVLAKARGHEIQAWLDWYQTVAQQTVEAFAILDDNSDMVHLHDHLVQTTWDRGLQNEHVERVVAMLNTAPPGARSA